MLPAPSRPVPTLAKKARLLLKHLRSRSPFAEIRAHFEDVKHAPPTAQRMLLIGDGLLVLLVVATVGGTALGSLNYPVESSDAPKQGSIPWLSFISTVAAFIVGWALVVTGASNGRRWKFYLILTVFVLSVLLVVGEESSERLAIIVMPVALAVLAVVLLSLRARSLRFLHSHQGLQFLIWILSLAVLLAVPLSEAAARPRLAQSLQVAHSLIVLLALFVLATIAVSAIWVIFDEAWVGVGWLERRVNDPRRFELSVLLLVLTATLSSVCMCGGWKAQRLRNRFNSPSRTGFTSSRTDHGLAPD